VEQQEEIIRYRMNLVRGKQFNLVTNLENRYVEKLQDIALAAGSTESEALFERAPKGMTFSDEHTPFGPSAPIEKFDFDCVKWERILRKLIMIAT
jgi:hypothetical protein